MKKAAEAMEMCIKEIQDERFDSDKTEMFTVISCNSELQKFGEEADLYEIEKEKEYQDSQLE